MDIDVLYEDNHLLMVEKPINVPVQADNSRDEDLLTILKKYIKNKYNKPGAVYLGLVHRLDRPVGGAMVFAKTSKAASRLANELRKQKIYRTYLAIIHGQPL
ncbi:pseudouridine synthase, partial [Staphylococcus arlettae]